MGAEAFEWCRRDTPDLILMDLIMPRTDGVEATRLIMATCPCAILVVTANVTENCSKVFDAMGAECFGRGQYAGAGMARLMQGERVIC
jgi:chemotaxis response regulator CheB